jgi:hypothetical protein
MVAVGWIWVGINNVAVVVSVSCVISGVGVGKTNSGFNSGVVFSTQLQSNPKIVIIRSNLAIIFIFTYPHRYP